MFDVVDTAQKETTRQNNLARMIAQNPPVGSAENMAPHPPLSRQNPLKHYPWKALIEPLSNPRGWIG